VTRSQTAVVLAGRYQLAGPLAAGGMGQVWRAVDLLLDRPVAVKLLRDEYAEHPVTLARFRAEARHAGALSHSGIAHVYDYGEVGPGQPPFLVMELVDGPPLSQLLTRGPLDPARVMDVVAQAAAGLGVAHAAGLVHRDIKPGNLLVGPGDTVKITDFGIAYAAGSAPITRTGTLIGTPAYLAPERVAGGSAGPASDLYSLGIVAYECLAGAPPFAGTPMEVALAHQQRALPPLSPAVPQPVAALITDLTAKDPADRPASASEVAERAGRLHDALAAADAAQPGHPLATPVTLDRAASTVPAGALRPTLAGLPDETLGLLPAADPSDARTRLPRRPRAQRPPGRLRQARPGRAAALAAVAIAIVAGLAVWLLVPGPASPPRHPSARTHVTGPAADRLVEIGGAMVGQPVSVVTQRLRQLGLRIRIAWLPSPHQDPGTVLSIVPAGRVPVGTKVVVTGATQPPGQAHRHGHGDGNGNGNGNGDGQGG
jgi:hypothetical protein